MDLSFTVEQRLLRDMLQEFLKERYSFDQRKAATRSQEGWRPDVWAAFAGEIGILGVGLPESAEGFGGSVETMVVMQELGSALVLEPYLETVVVGGGLLAAAGGPVAEAELLKIAAGQSTIAFAWSEPGLRHGFAEVAATAVQDGDGWRLTGTKALVVGAPWASRLIVTARTGGERPDRHGVSLFLIEPDAAGVSLDAFSTLDGRRAADVTLDGVRVPAAALLGEPGGAVPIVEAVIDRAIAAQCAETLGVMQRMLDETIAYIKDRKQFGQPLAGFQVLQHRVADMFMQIELATSATYLATLNLDGSASMRAKSVSSALVTTMKAARVVGQGAVQLHGGMGVTDELALTHYFRRLLVLNQTYGSKEYHLGRYAEIADAAYQRGMAARTGGDARPRGDPPSSCMSSPPTKGKSQACRWRRGSRRQAAASAGTS